MYCLIDGLIDWLIDWFVDTYTVKYEKINRKSERLLCGASPVMFYRSIFCLIDFPDALYVCLLTSEFQKRNKCGWIICEILNDYSIIFSLVSVCLFSVSGARAATHPVQCIDYVISISY